MLGRTTLPQGSAIRQETAARRPPASRALSAGEQARMERRGPMAGVGRGKKRGGGGGRRKVFHSTFAHVLSASNILDRWIAGCGHVEGEAVETAIEENAPTLERKRPRATSKKHSSWARLNNDRYVWKNSQSPNPSCCRRHWSSSSIASNSPQKPIASGNSDGFS